MEFEKNSTSVATRRDLRPLNESKNCFVASLRKPRAVFLAFYWLRTISCDIFRLLKEYVANCRLRKLPRDFSRGVMKFASHSRVAQCRVYSISEAQVRFPQGDVFESPYTGQTTVPYRTVPYRTCTVPNRYCTVPYRYCTVPYYFTLATYDIIRPFHSILLIRPDFCRI